MFTYKYKACLREELIRRGGKETTKSGMERDSKSRHWAAGVGSEMMLESTCVSGKKGKLGRDHMPKLTNWGDSNPTWEATKSEASKHPLRELQKNGKVNRLVGKIKEKEALLSENSPNLPTAQTNPTEGM